MVRGRDETVKLEVDFPCCAQVRLGSVMRRVESGKKGVLRRRKQAGGCVRVGGTRVNGMQVWVCLCVCLHRGGKEPKGHVSEAEEGPKKHVCACVHVGPCGNTGGRIGE